MSVKFGLLALLATEPMYGARLRAEFEARTGGTWPLNVGQVYTTLGRLERDGLVESTGEADDEGRIEYRLTDAGHQAIAQWWSVPVDRSNTPRDELVIKLALAVTVPGVDVEHVVQTQRTATLRHLRDLTRLKAQARDRADAARTDRTEDDATGHLAAFHAANDHAWRLVLDNLIFAAEAEVRWLDHVEADLAREATRARGAAHTSAGTDRPSAAAPARAFTTRGS